MLEDQVPDYTDMVDFYKKAKVVEKDLSEDQIRGECKATFEVVVKNLKNRRIHDFQSNLEGYLESEHLGKQEDPAVLDNEIKSTLDKQAAEGQARISKVIEEYVKKQAETKEEDPAESGDDNTEEEEEDIGEEGTTDDETVNFNEEDGGMDDLGDAAGPAVPELESGSSDSESESENGSEEVTLVVESEPQSSSIEIIE